MSDYALFAEQSAYLVILHNLASDNKIIGTNNHLSTHHKSIHYRQFMSFAHILTVRLLTRLLIPIVLFCIDQVSVESV